MILRKRVRNEEGGKGGRKQRREEVVLIRSPKTFPLDDRLFSTRRDAGEAARFLHPWRSWRIEGGKRGHSGLLARQGMLLLRYRRDTGGGNESTVVHTRCFLGYRFVFIARIFFCFGFRSLERNDSFFSVAISFKDFSRERVANSRTKSFFLLFR